jgi:leucyl-tRNA synthetase
MTHYRVPRHPPMIKELQTSHPLYYKFTQLLFLKLHNKGLAYKNKRFVNYDPVLQTVLANEQVDSQGRAERSGALVELRVMDQWFLSITHYAEVCLRPKDVNIDVRRT